MLEKLLERLKNQELTKEQELEIREEINKINSQIESNIQNRRTEALMKIKEDEKRSKELDDISIKLEKVRKKEKRRWLFNFLISLPIALLLGGNFFAGIMLINMFNLGTACVLLPILSTGLLTAGITLPLNNLDNKKYEINKKEEKELLNRYEELVNVSIDKIPFDKISSSSDKIISKVADEIDLDCNIFNSEQVIEENNIESL